MAHSTTCNPDVITNFLADRLSDLEQSAFEQHLDVCNDCCRELQARTADAVLWHDAKTFLSSTDNIALNAEDETLLGDVTRTHSSDMLRLDFLSATDDPLMLGRFAGYEVSGVVGCGGMGIVLKGFDLALNRYAAIKVLAPHYASSGAARQRFAREAQAAAAVVHDNVIAIHGVDEYNSLPYLVMPYIKGQSLQKRIDKEGRLSIAEILRIAMQTARGLAAAHDQGLVHRDIKPGNILLPENVERVMLTDFGLARAADDASLTRSGIIAGTPQYMSPEQARGEAIDSRSDLFSLGSVMYAMCTGRPPFRAENAYGILRRITDNEARPIREVNPEVPQWLCQIVERLLAKNADDRFASAHEVADLLEDCLAHVQQPNHVALPDSLQPGPLSPRWSPKAIVSVSLVAVLIVAAVRWPRDNPNRQAADNNVTESDRRPAPAGSSPPAALTEAPGVMMAASNEIPPPSFTSEFTDLTDTESWIPDDGLDQIEATLNDLNQSLTIETRFQDTE